MNYYPFHVGDYAAHTAHLEPMEDLAYRRMLDLYYLRESALPQDPAEIARLIRMRSNVAEVEAVLREFFTVNDGGCWVHARCEAELVKMQDRQSKARASAKASVDARIARHASERLSNAQRTLSERSADVELPTPIPTPEEKTKTARKRAAPAVLVSVDNLIEAGVEKQHAADWLAVRKVKNLPLTATAWAETQAEAVKAGLSIAEAIKKAAAEGWGGFKASWLAQVEAPRGQAPAAVTTPSTDKRADAYLAEQDQRAAAATRPPSAVLELARRSVRTA
jgi:uncharacterized protein YdaU (DUF1376 family)